MPCIALLHLGLAATARGDVFQLEGFVVGADNRPVPGATVSLDGTDIATVTDSLGGFVLHDVPSGRHGITARRGCVMSGYIDGIRIPRPLRVPLPIRIGKVDCGSTPSLDGGTLASLVARAFEALVSDERRALTTALLRDGAIRLLDGGNLASVDDVDIWGTSVPIAHLAAGDEFSDAIWLSVCVTESDDTVLVRLLDSRPDGARDIDVLIGNEALLSFSRGGDDDRWQLSRQLVCVAAEADDGEHAEHEVIVPD